MCMYAALYMLVYLPLAWAQYILLIIARLAEQIILFEHSHMSAVT
jgi:hypothetical protein